jgi:HSP20 family protein
MAQPPREAAVFCLGVAQRFGPTTWLPAADVFRLPDGWLVKVELPGIRLDDVAVGVRGRSLTVAGTRRDSLRKSATHELMEIAYGDFAREFSFPDDLTRARVLADYRDGMLMVLITTER